jgi:hypothetical protein
VPTPVEDKVSDTSPVDSSIEKSLVISSETIILSDAGSSSFPVILSHPSEKKSVTESQTPPSSDELGGGAELIAGVAILKDC